MRSAHTARCSHIFFGRLASSTFHAARLEPSLSLSRCPEASPRGGGIRLNRAKKRSIGDLGEFSLTSALSQTAHVKQRFSCFFVQQNVCILRSEGDVQSSKTKRAKPQQKVAGLTYPHLAEFTVEAPLGGVRVAGASAGTCVRQLWIEEALGSSIITIGFGVIGAPVCGLAAIIGIVMAGDMAPECMTLGTPI